MSQHFEKITTEDDDSAKSIIKDTIPSDAIEGTAEEKKMKYLESLNNAGLYTQHIFAELQQQTALLKSIKNGITFFVVLTILAIIIQSCSVLF